MSIKILIYGGLGNQLFQFAFGESLKITYKLLEDLTLTGSYTNPLGPGNNHFDKNLNFMRKPIYSFGLSWDINDKIGIETNLIEKDDNYDY